MMKRFGLIGHPISHSLSPALFKAGYGGRYPYDLIESADFDEAFKRFLEGYDGVNVTAPFKDAAFEHADIQTDWVKKTRAANLLVKTAEGIVAYNTDVDGVRLSIEEACQDETRKGKALIVGCGGAGRAALLAAALMGYETTIANRTTEKARAVAKAFEEYGTKALPVGEIGKELRLSDLIIYTVPGPMDIELSEDDFAGGKIVVEANYRNPFIKDRFSRAIERFGGKYISGERWLLYQAVSGYGIFTGENPDIAAMKQIPML